MIQKEWNRGHAMLRALQRYNVDLDDEQYDRLVNCILKGEIAEDLTCKFMGRVSKSKSVYKITYKNKEMIALYSSKQHNIQTFFPKEYDYIKCKMWAIANNRGY